MEVVEKEDEIMETVIEPVIKTVVATKDAEVEPFEADKVIEKPIIVETIEIE